MKIGDIVRVNDDYKINYVNVTGLIPGSFYFFKPNGVFYNKNNIEVDYEGVKTKYEVKQGLTDVFFRVNNSNINTALWNLLKIFQEKNIVEIKENNLGLYFNDFIKTKMEKVKNKKAPVNFIIPTNSSGNALIINDGTLDNFLR